jgi:aminoglycoside phosphotransferase (APT) family kinase protein
MTLQHEATLAVPEGVQPGLLRALQLVLRELDQVLIPDLQSDSARSTAGMLGQLLRQLIVRESVLPALLDDWTGKQETLLREADVVVDVADAGSFERNRRVTEAVAALTAERAFEQTGPVSAGLTDQWSRRAVAVEREYLATRMHLEQSAPYPQNSAERTAALKVTPERLTAYLTTKLSYRGSLLVTQVHKLLGGFSKETFIIDAEVDGQPRSVVLRRDVPLGAVAGSVADEVPLLKALHGAGFPVPEPLLVETDCSIFGEAFAITRKAPGATAFSNVRGLDMGDGQQNAAHALAEVLGRLHAMDARNLQLPKRFFDPALSMGDCVMRQIDDYEKAWFSRTYQPSPTMSAAFAWLRANVPPSTGRPGIVHGDAGLHNLMMHEGKVSVMLDWELSHMGDPLEDLAYCRSWVDQALPWEEFLEVYYRYGGFPYRPEFESFYSVLANLRVVVFAAQAGYGSYWSEHPELTLMFATAHYHAVFVDKVAKHLAEN